VLRQDESEAGTGGCNALTGCRSGDCFAPPARGAGTAGANPFSELYAAVGVNARGEGRPAGGHGSRLNSRVPSLGSPASCRHGRHTPVPSRDPDHQPRRTSRAYQLQDRLESIGVRTGCSGRCKPFARDLVAHELGCSS
jgi:hypothetical protein